MRAISACRQSIRAVSASTLRAISCAASRSLVRASTPRAQAVRRMMSRTSSVSSTGCLLKSPNCTAQGVHLVHLADGPHAALPVQAQESVAVARWAQSDRGEPVSLTDLVDLGGAGLVAHGARQSPYAFDVAALGRRGEGLVLASHAIPPGAGNTRLAGGVASSRSTRLRASSVLMWCRHPPSMAGLSYMPSPTRPPGLIAASRRAQVDPLEHESDEQYQARDGRRILSVRVSMA